MKRSPNIAVFLTLALLLLAVAALALLNRGDAELRRALEENREFIVSVNGESVATVGLQALLDLEPEEFTTSIATSIATPREARLRGVELRKLLNSLDIETVSADRVAVTGLDGYTSLLSRAEVESEEHIYICYYMDGEVLKTQGEGGYGPYLMVVRGSRFAQRWCKYVESVDVIN